MSAAGLHIYYSALPLATSGNLLRRQFPLEMFTPIKTIYDLEAPRSPRLRMIDCETSQSVPSISDIQVPSSIVFILQGHGIMSFVDSHISPPAPGVVWNAETGCLIRNTLSDNLDGRDHHFLCISPRGTRIAQYYPQYCEIGILDSATGRHCAKLKSSFKDMAWNNWKIGMPPRAIAFSYDDNTIATTSLFDTSPGAILFSSELRIELWSAETGDKLQLLSAGVDSLSSHWLKYEHLTFSHHSTMIAYMENCLAPHCHRLSLCDVNNEQTLCVIDFQNCGLDRHHLPRCCWAQVLFSPDDTLVALGCSGTGTISLYNTDCGQSIASFSVPAVAPEVQDLLPMQLKFFASDLSSACIISLQAIHSIPQQSLSPATISAIYEDSQYFYHIRNDGWVFDGKKQVCWFPPDYRPVRDLLQASQGCKLAIGTKEKGVVMIEFSQSHSVEPQGGY